MAYTDRVFSGFWKNELYSKRNDQPQNVPNVKTGVNVDDKHDAVDAVALKAYKAGYIMPNDPASVNFPKIFYALFNTEGDVQKEGCLNIRNLKAGQFSSELKETLLTGM